MPSRGGALRHFPGLWLPRPHPVVMGQQPCPVALGGQCSRGEGPGSGTEAAGSRSGSRGLTQSLTPITASSIPRQTAPGLLSPPVTARPRDGRDHVKG